MKAKIITSLIALSMVMSLTACNTDKAENSADLNTTTTEISAVNEDTKQEISKTASEQTENAIPEDYFSQRARRAETGNVYYSYPSNYMCRNEALLDVIFKDHTEENSLVAVGAAKNESIDELIDIVGLFNTFGSSVTSYSNGNLTYRHIEVISHEPAILNGRQAEKFIGKIPNMQPATDKTWDCHVAGYVFEIENVQIMVVSLVSEMAQNPDVIEKSDDLMEKIAGTIRLEPYVIEKSVDLMETPLQL